MIETRYAELDRPHGRTLSGVAIRYGDLATIRHPVTRELMQDRIEAGAFGDLTRADVTLDLQHDRRRLLSRTGSGLAFENSGSELRMTATLPETRDADDALELVRSGVLRGLSVEFHTRSERRDHGVRVIQRAHLVSIGVVDSPAYKGSLVEARRAGLAVSGKIPYGRPLACRCVSGPCQRVQFQRDSLRARRRGADEADADLDGGGLADFGDPDAGEVLAVVGDYAHAVASLRRGTLIINQADDGLEIGITRLPETQAGRELAEQARNVPLYARPVFVGGTQDDAAGVAHIRNARLRAITIGPTDATDGWTPIVVEGVEQLSDARSERPRVWRRSERRRVWL